MVARAKYDDETIRKALELAKTHGFRGAERLIGIHEGTIRVWRRAGDQAFGKQSRTKSQLLDEFSKLILVQGPECPSTVYDNKASHPGEWKKHWRNFPEFRNEAANLCPLVQKYNKRIFLEVKDALFIIGSDAHYWPYWGASCAHRALVYLAPILKPTHIVLNGDIPDHPQITHHRPIAWKTEPTLKEEMDEVHLRVGEIEDAMSCERLWNWGNHCIRWDNTLAEKVPAFKDITGMSLQHHFPRWKFQNTIRVNELELEIKHRYRGGELAVRNNVMRGGINIVTGHDHNRQLYRFRDARGTRWGSILA